MVAAELPEFPATKTLCCCKIGIVCIDVFEARLRRCATMVLIPEALKKFLKTVASVDKFHVSSP
jgi:hypothetical protein